MRINEVTYGKLKTPLKLNSNLKITFRTTFLLHLVPFLRLGAFITFEASTGSPARGSTPCHFIHHFSQVQKGNATPLIHLQS